MVAVSMVDDIFNKPSTPPTKSKPASLATEDYPSRCSTPWTSPEKRKGRFNADELSCFKRLPTPSPFCAQKAESYWQTDGGLRRVFSESGLHILPVSKGGFWHSRNDEPSETDADVSSNSGITRLPLEDRTAMVLDRIYPRSSNVDAYDRGSCDGKDHAGKRHQLGNEPLSWTNQCRKTAIPNNTRQGRFLHLRQKLLEKFNSIKNAFDSFLQQSGDYNKELSFKEFSRFLKKHIPNISQKEQERIFDFLDSDKSGGVSLNEFHIAVEASAHVRNMDDLRRRWIALGFTSMRQALMVMENSLDKSGLAKRSSQRLGFPEFAAALCRVGVSTNEEHHAIFTTLSNMTGWSTVSLDELTSALSSVSPPLLLEYVRERLLKGYGSLYNAYKALDVDDDGDLTREEFVQRAAHEFKMSLHEAAKAFELIDIDGNHSISLVEFVSALRLSEPGLFLEEVRRKVRQRFRCIREAFELGEQEVDKFVQDSVSGGHVKYNSRPFRRASVFFKDTETKSLSEVHSVLSSLLTASETKLIYQMIDIDGEGKLTSVEFVRGIRLFAPSCVLEELRSRCLAKHDCVRDVFLDAVPVSSNDHISPKHEKPSMNQRLDSLYDKKQLRTCLENLDLARGIDVDAVFDLVESRHDGGLHINELIVALESSAFGMQVPLSPELRDARARQQVRWHMAPFHRSVLELRHEVRQKPVELSEECGQKSNIFCDTKCQKPSLPEQCRRVRSLPNLNTVSPQKSSNPPSQDQAASRTSCGDSPSHSASFVDESGSRVTVKGKRASVAYQPTKRSYKKVSQLLESMPTNNPLDIDGQDEAILERITDYFQNAGETMAHDCKVLKSLQHRLAPFEKSRSITRR